MTLIVIFIVLFSIIIHEYSHGWVAYRLGDPTPKISNRLTFNPLSHIDFFGTVLLPFLLIILSGGRFAFGYAKPIPINPYNFKNPKKDIMWVGIAGPTSNFLAALILSLMLKFRLPEFLVEIIGYGILINLIFCVFNLIPIPPLDGSKIIASFLSYRNAYRYLKMEIFGFFIIIVLISFGFLEWFVFPLIRLLLNILNVKGMII